MLQSQSTSLGPTKTFFRCAFSGVLELTEKGHTTPFFCVQKDVLTLTSENLIKFALG